MCLNVPTVNKNYFFNLRTVGTLKLPFKQPYATKQFMGHEDQYMQGYEYYVVDGVAGGYAKASITRPIFNKLLKFPVKNRHLSQVPLKLFAKTFVNAGYVYNDRPGQNELTNKMLYSAGIGLDIIVFADFIIKMEWSFNRLGENGLYLHKRNYF